VLVNQLGVAIPPQQHTEIVEPGDDALQLDPVDQKYRQRDFVFPDVIEKSILQVLCAIGCHGRVPFFCPRLARRIIRCPVPVAGIAAGNKLTGALLLEGNRPAGASKTCRHGV
jgi:hypothetical protein